MMKRSLILTVVLFFGGLLHAQDFQCQVSINSSKISGSNRERYNSLQQELYKFINDRKWCQYTFKTNERIECGLMINLTEPSYFFINLYAEGCHATSRLSLRHRMRISLQPTYSGYESDYSRCQKEHRPLHPSNPDSREPESAAPR